MLDAPKVLVLASTSTDNQFGALKERMEKMLAALYEGDIAHDLTLLNSLVMCESREKIRQVVPESHPYSVDYF